MFELLEDYLPHHLSSETQLYVRSTLGAMVAASVVTDPAVGALVLLGHATWEFAGLYFRSGLSEQDLRTKLYNEEFDELVRQAKALGAKCTNEEINNARHIFFVHNLIEEVCYKALPEIVAELGIKGDVITEDQSGQILAHLKNKAHVELRKEGGYTKTGSQMITKEQFDLVLKSLVTLIHDRDTRLTDARYTSLTDLCAAADDHNTWVKNLLFKSWFKCEKMQCDSHLSMIKKVIGLNEKMSEILGYDFENALDEKKRYLDQTHPHIREIECPKTHALSAQEYVNLSEVRGKFKDTVAVLLKSDPQQYLIGCLRENQLFSGSEIDCMTKPRCGVDCYPRFHKRIEQPQLLDPKLTVGEFLARYFPEEITTHSYGQQLDKGCCAASVSKGV